MLKFVYYQQTNTIKGDLIMLLNISITTPLSMLFAQTKIKATSTFFF